MPDKAMIDISGLGFYYLDPEQPILKDIDLQIQAGEFVIIVGASGCGKSTLCRTFNGVIPHLSKGCMTGSVSVAGLDTQQVGVSELAQRVGMVFQNPESNIFSLIVQDELAFGPENLGLPRHEIARRVRMAADVIELWPLWAAKTQNLSGGQKQKVAIGSCLTMLPQILVLDQPTTDLDPISKQTVIDTLRILRGEYEMTNIVVEHDLDILIDRADRLIALDGGRIVADGPPRQVLTEHHDWLTSIGIRIPPYVEVGYHLARAGCPVESYPLNFKEALELIEKYPTFLGGLIERLGAPPPPPTGGEPVVTVENLSFGYLKKHPVLKGIDLEVKAGEFTAIVGANGSGKSTLIKCIVGLLKPTAGQIVVHGRNTRRMNLEELTQRVGYVFQNPDTQLFENTVWDEVSFGLRVRHAPPEQIEARTKEILERFNLLHLKERHPATLSRGEKRRLAVATALVAPLDILLMDEPTTGQDYRTLHELMEILAELNRDYGTTIIMVTHDMEVVWEYASRTIGMSDGQIIFDGPTRNVLARREMELVRQARLRVPLAAALAEWEKEGASFVRSLAQEDVGL